MEPPAGPDSRFLQDEKAKVMAAMKPIDPKELVRGQYVGYRDEPGVAPDSSVETFAAARLEIDSWRWAGVPWYVRVGKGLTANATEAVVEFHSPPRMLFDEAGGPRTRTATWCGCGWASATASRSRCRPRRPASTSTARTSTSPSTSQPRSASAARRTNGCSATRSPAHRAGSPARTWSSRPGGSCSRRSITPARCTRTSAAAWGPAEADRLVGPGDHWFEPSQ